MRATANPFAPFLLGAASFEFAYKATGLITNGSYSAKNVSANFVIFINDRLVSSTSIKHAAESVYNDILPTRGKPFVYLSLEVSKRSGGGLRKTRNIYEPLLN